MLGHNNIRPTPTPCLASLSRPSMAWACAPAWLRQSRSHPVRRSGSGPTIPVRRSLQPQVPGDPPLPVGIPALLYWHPSLPLVSPTKRCRMNLGSGRLCWPKRSAGKSGCSRISGRASSHASRAYCSHRAGWQVLELGKLRVAQKNTCYSMFHHITPSETHRFHDC